MRLLAGITDRILDLWRLGEGYAHHVIAVNYPCKIDNKYHAQGLFKLFGFEHRGEWHTSDGDHVYILDLNKQPNDALRRLREAVLTRREKYRQDRVKSRKRKLRILSGLLLVIALIVLLEIGWVPTIIPCILSIFSFIVSLLTDSDNLFRKYIAK